MKQIVENQTFDAERAFYGADGLLLCSCAFDGPADGESALKEAANIEAQRCFFNLRYPFWHDNGVTVRESELSPLCRAALWYSENIVIEKTKLHGIKALRECRDATLTGCDIVSPEFGWSTHGVRMTDCTAESEYFMMRATELAFRSTTLHGKYSFQYIENATFENCAFYTKDAFWHAKNVTVKNSIVSGEYLAWYSDGLTLIGCEISGTQPFCYCKNLTLVDCTMTDTDLCFEKSEVNAEVKTPIVSVKNPRKGTIVAPSVGALIMDDSAAKGKVILRS